MKKLFWLLSILVICFTLTACSKEDKYSNFEHYDLKDKVVNYYNYINNEGAEEVYTVADITPEPYEFSVYGIFYKIADNDFILLDMIESNSSIENIARFYNNKLHVLGRGSTVGILEYTLNQEKTSKKEITYDFYKGFLPMSIEEIIDNEISYSAMTNDDITGFSISINIKCSLYTYKCQESDD